VKIARGSSKYSGAYFLRREGQFSWCKSDRTEAKNCQQEGLIMAEGAVVTVGYLFNAVTKSSGWSRRLRSLASRFGKVPYRYASLNDRLNILSRPHLSRLVEMRRDFLFHDEFGEMQHDRWAMELGRFIDETVLPYLGPHKAFAQRRLLYVAGCLDDMVAAAR
jgi:hypothetical protein